MDRRMSVPISRELKVGKGIIRNKEPTISSSSPLVGYTITMAGFAGNFLLRKEEGGDSFWSTLSRRMYP
jgi:hypothetical protein